MLVPACARERVRVAVEAQKSIKIRSENGMSGDKRCLTVFYFMCNANLFRLDFITVLNFSSNCASSVCGSESQLPNGPLLRDTKLPFE